MMYLVTGMHKSGTTLVAETLHASSVPMVEDREAAPGGYDEGRKFERESFRRLNQRVLGLPPGHHSLRVPRSRSATDDTARAMAEAVASLEERHGAWGAKDPRFCLTYDAWRPRLPRHRVVGVYRHPARVWGHYRRHTRRPWARPLHVVLALRAWILHNLGLVEILEATDALLVEYDRLMTEEEELERLGEFVGRELRDVRDPGLYRARAGSGRGVELLDPLLGAVYPAGALELWERLEAARSGQIDGVRA